MKEFTRNIRRTVRFNELEDNKLTELCKQEGMTRSEWVREKVNNARINCKLRRARGMI